jgi:hypothetical protein
MTDRAAAFAALGSRITKAAADHDLKDPLSAHALREAADLANSTDLTSDPPAALVLRTFHVLRSTAGPAGPHQDKQAEGRWSRATAVRTDEQNHVLRARRQRGCVRCGTEMLA